MVSHQGTCPDTGMPPRSRGGTAAGATHSRGIEFAIAYARVRVPEIVEHIDCNREAAEAIRGIHSVRP
ncbi:hypothetical protein AB0L63_05375 [Nocardia sp. NPDC051990]|uniref:hypothetical protein n=1 Tax=Nocardia sp. NPDC051990 TaxID=3155285 RepID=UPI003418C783